MKKIVCTILLVMYGGALHAQALCIPQPIEYMQWGNPGQGVVPGATVPAGKVWKIRAVGIATEVGPLDYMLQIEHPVAVQGGACCWLIPLHVNPTARGSTPVLALEREILLIAGERMSARVANLPPDKRMAITYVGWEFPEACTPALVAPGAP